VVNSHERAIASPSFRSFRSPRVSASSVEVFLPRTALVLKRVLPRTQLSLIDLQRREPGHRG
jgi:hypothetical protein